VSRAIGIGARLDIDGWVFAWNIKLNNPQLVTFDGEKWLPIFSTVNELDASMSELKVEHYTVKRIDDGLEFLASIAENPGLRVCTDLRREDGKLRFRWIKLPP
jgi:hypothetical protein